MIKTNNIYFLTILISFLLIGCSFQIGPILIRFGSQEGENATASDSVEEITPSQESQVVDFGGEVPDCPKITENEDSRFQVSEIHFFSELEGWAVVKAAGYQDSIAKTTDGGITWENVGPYPGVYNGVAVATFVSNDTAWITYTSGYPYGAPEPHLVWVTNDGGQTWQESKPIEVSIGEIYLVDPIVVASQDVAYMLIHVGGGMSHDYAVLLKTIDGGMSWRILFSPNENFDAIESYSKTGLAFLDESIGWMTYNTGGVSDGVYLGVTTNGGTGKWESRFVKPPDEFISNPETGYCSTYDPRLQSPSIGMLRMRCKEIGDTLTITNYLYKTFDGGNTWQSYSIPGDNFVIITNEIGFSNADGLYTTENGGTNWEKISDRHFTALSFVNRYLGWGIQNEFGTYKLFRTTDGGQSWCEFPLTIGIGWGIQNEFATCKLFRTTDVGQSRCEFPVTIDRGG